MAPIKKKIFVHELTLPGCDGETIEMWTNFPNAVLEQFWDSTGQKFVEFVQQHGIIVGTSLQTEAGDPLPVEEMPWDVLVSARRGLQEELARIVRATWPEDEAAKA